MKVLVAGASGAIGRRLTPLLVKAGHTVTGMTRSPDRAAQIRAAGAEVVIADALDKAAVMAANGRRRSSACGRPGKRGPSRDCAELRGVAVRQGSGPVKTEGDPLDPNPPAALRAILQAILDRRARRRHDDRDTRRFEAKAKRELGWEPVWGSWRDGFRKAL